MTDPYPTIEESSTAVVKAVAARRARHRADPTYTGLTTAAIAERVTGITLPPRGGRDGWWLVGRVLDELVEAEFSVWYMPGPRRIGLSRRDRPLTPTPAPPRQAVLLRRITAQMDRRGHRCGNCRSERTGGGRARA